MTNRLKPPKNYRYRWPNPRKNKRSCENCAYRLRELPKMRCLRGNPVGWDNNYSGAYVCDGHKREA